MKSQHPSLPKLRPSSSELSKETSDWIDHVGSGIESEKYPRIDLSRYTNPFDESTQSSSSNPSLKNAYIALAYAQDRLENLSMLEEYGKNQWLVGNDELDQTVSQLEAAVREERAALELTQQERRTRQENSKVTMEYLEKRWVEGIRNVVDVNIAVLQLKQQRSEK